MNPEHITWSRNHFEMLADGGAWGIPRSGLIYTRRGDCLMLTHVMPHSEEMDITEEQLKDQQLREIANIKLHFEAAGIAVIDATSQENNANV